MTVFVQSLVHFRSVGHLDVIHVVSMIHYYSSLFWRIYVCNSCIIGEAGLVSALPYKELYPALIVINPRVQNHGLLTAIKHSIMGWSNNTHS